MGIWYEKHVTDTGMTEQSPATIGTLPKSAFAQCLHALKDTKTFRLEKIAAKRREERIFPPTDCHTLFLNIAFFRQMILLKSISCVDNDDNE